MADALNVAPHLIPKRSTKTKPSTSNDLESRKEKDNPKSEILKSETLHPGTLLLKL